MSEIKLLQGDCLELMKNIPDKSIDLVLCDPPYGTTSCSWDSIIDLDELWNQYNRIIKDVGAIVLFDSEPFSSKVRISNIKKYKYDWIWEKSGASSCLSVKKMPLKVTENIMVFSSKKMNYYPIQKPVELLKYLIKTYTKEGDMVLDNCMGSGSTGVACKNLNRNFIGIELDENYFNIAKQRIENGFVQEDVTDEKLNSLPLFLE